MKLTAVFFGLNIVVISVVVTSWYCVVYKYDQNPSFRHVGWPNFTLHKRTAATHPEVLRQNIATTIFQNIPESDYAASVSKAFLSTYKSYLSIKSVTDLKRIASNTSSTQSLGLNKSVYSLGDDITVHIILFDGYGKRLTQGGDILRIWLTGTSQKTRVNGYVIDHGNGSYIGHVRALWTGKSVIKTSIAATKEQIASVIKYIEKHGLMHDMVGGFKNNNITERTLCSVKPNVFGLSDMCNFTEENYGLHWFCGTPRNPKLKCQDWKFTKGAYTNHLSETERTIARVHKHMLLQKSPTITITGGTNYVPSPDLPCYTRPINETWHEESPVGFYYKGKWHQRGCKNTFIPSKISYENCLRNQYLFLIGDSNIRSWFDHIQQKAVMVIPENEKGQKGRRWFSLRRVVREDLNFTLVWAVHEQPFYSGEDSPREMIKSVAWYIDRIPNMKKVTVVLHNILHFARITPSEFREHIRDVKFAIGRLFKRIPGARVFVKGPHSVTYVGFLIPLDFIRKIHEQLFYEEFMEFHNKITYLNEWDLTTCIENVNVHPSIVTVGDMVDKFVIFV